MTRVAGKTAAVVATPFIPLSQKRKEDAGAMKGSMSSWIAANISFPPKVDMVLVNGTQRARIVKVDRYDSDELPAAYMVILREFQ